MTLIAECLDTNVSEMAACLVNPGGGAAPGGQWSGETAASCMNYDQKAMVECLTGVPEDCCLVLGVHGCTLLVNGEPITVL